MRHRGRREMKVFVRAICWIYHLGPPIGGLSKRQALVGIVNSNASRQGLVENTNTRERKTTDNGGDCVELQNTYLI